MEEQINKLRAIDHIEMWLTVGLIVDAVMVIMSVERFFSYADYSYLLLTSILFGWIVFTIRWLNREQ